MKVTTLIENKASDRENLNIEYGLSLYIELDGKKILFDTGQSGDFIDNSEKLNIDLKELDYIIISHGHFDHSGGLKRLIKEINPNIELYLGDGFFNEKYNLRKSGDYEYTGNPFNKEFLKEYNIATKYIDKDITKITENLFIFSNFNRNEEFENVNEKMYVKKDGKYKKDNFKDEISIAIKTNKGLLVIVGCSHVGIVNILDTIIQRMDMNIHALIGGTPMW
ncbi:MAG: MBL fold metallo-hydrolase [Senegalia sp. (in: firmicutes)]